MIVVGISQQVMSLPPLECPLPGAAPPDRRAALELRMAQLRAAPPKSESASRSDELVTLSPVSTESGEGHTRMASGPRRPLFCRETASLESKHSWRSHAVQGADAARTTSLPLG